MKTSYNDEEAREDGIRLYGVEMTAMYIVTKYKTLIADKQGCDFCASVADILIISFTRRSPNSQAKRALA